MTPPEEWIQSCGIVTIAVSITRTLLASVAAAAGHDVAGNVASSIDPNQNATHYDYADSDTDSSPGNTYAFVTQQQNALSQTQTWQYEYNSGKPAAKTDANGVTTLYRFNDPLDRLVQVRKAALSGGAA